MRACAGLGLDRPLTATGPDPERLLASPSPRGWLSYALAWTAPVVISASANAALATPSLAVLAEYLLLYSGYWAQWALAAPLAYRLVARFAAPRRRLDRIASVAAQALLVLALISGANLYFHVWNSFAAHAETFGPEGLRLRLERTGLILVGVHLFKYAVLVLICLLVRQGRLRRLEEDSRVATELANRQLARELSEARLTALQGQLNPHLLFNALNCIAGLIDAGRNGDAYAAVGDLATLLRRTLEAAQRELAPLREDLGLALAYLRIAKLRFGDRITWRFDVDEAAEVALAPALLLQPLVENAVKHAVERTERPIEIVVTAHCEPGIVRVGVWDNGPGFGDAASSGVGLANLKARLALLFGPQAAVQFGSQVGGASVRIVFPYTRAAEVSAE